MTRLIVLILQAPVLGLVPVHLRTPLGCLRKVEVTRAKQSVSSAG